MNLLFTRLLLLATALSLSGCLYFNLYYNFQKAYDQAVDYRDDRLTQNPDDTTWTTKEEKDKLLRTITKGSKILETYPAEIEYKPKVLFFMGSAFYRMGRWEKAVIKFNEYEKYFPYHDSIPSAQYQRAYCHFQNSEIPIAYYELRQIIEQGNTHPYYNAAVLLLAEVSHGEQFNKSAIENIEKLLESDISSKYIKAKLHFQLAQLYFEEKRFSDALIHYSDETVEELSDLMFYTAFHRSLECLYIQELYPEGIALIAEKEGEKRFKAHKLETGLMHSRFLLKTARYTQGTTLLDSIIINSKEDKKRLTSEAYFVRAEYHHYTMGELESARDDYQSAYEIDNSAPWANTANGRANALKKTRIIREKKSKTFEDFFKIAELYLFTLSNPDSAIQNLNQLSQRTNEDTDVLARAEYAKAFIFDEFQRDSKTADSLYKEVIRKYPQSQYAQQAEKNLGVVQTVQTSEDLAYKLFLSAEELYFSLDSIGLVNPTLFDSLENIAVLQYDSVAQHYPTTAYGIKAHYTLAWIYEYQRADTAAARAKYQHIVETYPDSPYAKIAKDKLDPHLKYSDERLDKLRKKLEQAIKREEQRTKRIQKQTEEQQRIEEAEELLETDYNKMYEFGK